MNKELCPLCNSASEKFFENKNQLYYLCQNCKGIFLSKELLPDRDSEVTRYKQHNNDVDDIRYHKFVSPIVNSVLKDFSLENSGLDFGAGTGPVISKLLIEKNYKIEQYDPFFKNLPDLLKNKYDYIVCCEVIEHFHKPAKEFELLRSLLTERGKIYCMTNILNKNIDFKNWYYKEDYTHVFFYQHETFTFIKKVFGFSEVQITNNLIIFSY